MLLAVAAKWNTRRLLAVAAKWNTRSDRRKSPLGRPHKPSYAACWRERLLRRSRGAAIVFPSNVWIRPEAMVTQLPSGITRAALLHVGFEP